MSLAAAQDLSVARRTGGLDYLTRFEHQPSRRWQRLACYAWGRINVLMGRH